VVGVPLSGVDWALSTLDFREDDRGVTLLLRKAWTGVENCSLEVVVDAEPARSLWVDLRLNVGVAAAASFGVTGDFTVRFDARVGFNGRFALFAPALSQGMLLTMSSTA